MFERERKKCSPLSFDCIQAITDNIVQIQLSFWRQQLREREKKGNDWCHKYSACDLSVKWNSIKGGEIEAAASNKWVGQLEKKEKN